MSCPRETMTSFCAASAASDEHGGGGVVVDDRGRLRAGQFRQNVFHQFIALGAFAGFAVHRQRAITLQLAQHRVHHARRQNGAAQAGVQDDAGGVDGFAHVRFGGVLEKFFRLRQRRLGGDRRRAAAAASSWRICSRNPASARRRHSVTSGCGCCRSQPAAVSLFSNSVMAGSARSNSCFWSGMFLARGRLGAR